MRNIIKKLFLFFRQGWVISLIGVSAIALLVWFFGPLISIGDKSPLLTVRQRLITIATLYAIWLAIRVWGYYRNKRNNAAMVESMLDDDGPSLDDQAADEELQALKQRMDDALVVLKQARLGKKNGKRFLYQLPWYVIIGPPGAGKTTLLRNSDLKFPLAEQNSNESVQGIGGTRNCDWWFTEDAVLLDTAGRYTTQDSNLEVDSRSWLGFLDLLKKHRKRRPINGAIVAVSLDDMLRMSEAERITHASSIRARLHELQDRLNIRFPVYMMFTKVDLLAGFTEFFDDLNYDNRSQVWGMTLPFNEDPDVNAIEQFDEEFTLLEQRLHQHLVAKLESERNAERRNSIYAFPQQFSATRSVIGQFVKEVFISSRYQHAVMVRGVYFTSATQEGSPIDRLMGSLANQFGLAHENLSALTGAGKSFFINKLFSGVIFGEAELAGTNLRHERKRTWIKGLLLASALLATVTTLFAWLYSYQKNNSYISSIDQTSVSMIDKANNLAADDKSILSTLDLLNESHSIASNQDEKTRLGRLRYGLNQAGKLNAAATSKYTSLLRSAFLPRLISRLESQLELHTDDSDYLFEALKVYLMMDDKKHYDPEVIRAWIIQDWEANLPVETTTEQLSSLALHLDSLLDKKALIPLQPLNASLVELTRNTLLATPIEQRVYGQLKLSLNHSSTNDFTLIKGAGRDAPLVFSRKSGQSLNKGVSGFYTYAGFHNDFVPANRKISKKLSDESWILGETELSTGDDDSIARLEENVLKLYLDDFGREWEVFIADIKIVPFANLEQAVEILNIITSENSPLKTLFVSIDNETNLSRVKKDAGTQAGTDGTISDNRVINRGLQRAKNKASAIVNRLPGAQQMRRARVLNSRLKRFTPVSGMVRAENDETPPIDITLGNLKELYIHLNALLQATGDELVLQQRKVISRQLQKIKTESKRQPYPMNKMLEQIANSSSSLVNGDICEHINAKWKSDVYQFCARAINNRYPIRKKKRSIAQDDFAQMFAPGGRIDSFFTKYLQSSVDTTSNSWRWEIRDNNPACASNISLGQFKNARIIKDTFFKFGSSLPSSSFTLKPISMSQNITKLFMDIDGQKLEYAHGPVRSTSIKWPGPNNSGTINLQLSPALPNSRSGITFDGPWALYRLFDQATITRIGQSDNYIVRFDLDGRELTFELRSNSTYNPFNLNALRNFSCPPVL